MSEVFRARIDERGILGWWYLQTAPRERTGASFVERELVRRGRLASTLILGFVITGFIQLPFVYRGPQTLLTRLPEFLCLGFMIWLNRIGKVNITGALVVLTSYIALASILTTGKLLDLTTLSVFDMLVIPELMAVSLLPPISIFPVAVANSIIILAIARFQPHTAEFSTLLASADGRAVLTRAIALQFIVAIVAYLWVRSAVIAIRRADQAEVVAALERREAERTHELEEGAHQLLNVLVRLANGDFTSRVPFLTNSLLWRIGTAINMLIGRLERSSHAQGLLQRFEDESNRLAQAIYSLRPGDRDIWLTPQGTPLDRVLEALRATLPRLSGAQTHGPATDVTAFTTVMLPPQQQPGQPPQLPEASWPALAPRPQDGPQDGPPGQELPEWLRPPDGEWR